MLAPNGKSFSSFKIATILLSIKTLPTYITLVHYYLEWVIAVFVLKELSQVV